MLLLLLTAVVLMGGQFSDATSRILQKNKPMRQVIPRIFGTAQVFKCLPPPKDLLAHSQKLHEQYNQPDITYNSISECFSAFNDVLAAESIPKAQLLFVLEILKVAVAVDPAEHARNVWKMLATIIKYHISSLSIASKVKELTMQLFGCLPNMWREESTFLSIHNIFLYQASQQAPPLAVKSILNVLTVVHLDGFNLRDLYLLTLKMFEAPSLPVYFRELARFLKVNGDRRLLNLLVQNCFSSRADPIAMKHQLAVLRFLMINKKFTASQLTDLLARVQSKHTDISAYLEKSLIFELLSHIYERLLVLAVNDRTIDLPPIYRLALAMSTNQNLVRFRRERLLIVLSYWAKQSNLTKDLVAIISRLQTIKKSHTPQPRRTFLNN